MEICPQEAKTFDSDLAYVKSLLYKKERVVVSLDPSYRGLLDYEDSGQIVDALLKLGFSQVRETAEGAGDYYTGICASYEGRKDGQYHCHQAVRRLSIW